MAHKPAPRAQAGNGPIVVVLGAGATAACGGPLTNEILHEAFQLSRPTERAINLDLIDRFLREQFRVPMDISKRTKWDYPSLPLIMSLIDIAIDRKHSFGAEWNAETMASLRHALDLAIFSVLQYRIRNKPDLQEVLLRKLNKHARNWGIVSLNYDIFPDNALVQMSDRSGQVRFADYGCDIFLPGPRNDRNDPTSLRHRPTFGKLLKLHGSLNWIYCPHCHRLDLVIAEKGNLTAKALRRFLPHERKMDRLLEARYERAANRCEACGAQVRPVMISPSLYKDYRNPHISRIWYEAEMLLRQASAVVFVGYSFPDDDVHVAYLMKRALQHLSPADISVVESVKKRTAKADNPVHQRYQAMFGKGFNWFDKGLERWLDQKADLAFRRRPQ